MLLRWGNHPAFFGFTPVNEPWWFSDQPTLKQFYRDVRAKMQTLTPDAYFVFSDAFMPVWVVWEDLFPEGERDKVAVDHHEYIIFGGENLPTVEAVCANYGANMHRMSNEFRSNGYELWFGEWSLATDMCATWLSGFNDANMG